MQPQLTFYVLFLVATGVYAESPFDTIPTQNAVNQYVGQNSTVSYRLSINETLKDFMLAELNSLHETKWQLVAPNGAVYNGEGLVLAAYTFNQPGTYTVAFTRVHEHTEHSKGCNHYYMPDEISIVVNAQKIEFLCETLTTSKPIVGGQPTDGITLSIQVKVTGTEVGLPQLIRTAGVETSIVATLNSSQTILSTGLHTLTYHLSGQGETDSYISFDFPDANGHEIACGYIQKL